MSGALVTVMGDEEPDCRVYLREPAPNSCIFMHSIIINSTDDLMTECLLLQNCSFPNCTAFAITKPNYLNNTGQVCMHASPGDTECVCNIRLDIYRYHKIKSHHIFWATECHPETTPRATTTQATTTTQAETTRPAEATTTTQAETTRPAEVTTTAATLVCTYDFFDRIPEIGLCIYDSGSSSGEAADCTGLGRIIEIGAQMVSVI